MNDIYLKKPRKKRKRKIGSFVVEEEGDYPVHEEYTKEKPVKEG